MSDPAPPDGPTPERPLDVSAPADSSVAPMPLDLEPTRTGRRPLLIVSIGVLVVAIVVVVVVLVTRKPTGYTSDDQQKFMSACMAGGGEPVRSTCACIYDQLTSKVPYERYVTIDSELQSQRAADPNTSPRFPAEVEAIRADCVARSK